MDTKYWKTAGAAGLLFAFLCGTAFAGTYVYYNDKGKVVRYISKKKTEQSQSVTGNVQKSSSVKSTGQAPKGEKFKLLGDLKKPESP